MSDVVINATSHSIYLVISSDRGALRRAAQRQPWLLDYARVGLLFATIFH